MRQFACLGVLSSTIREEYFFVPIRALFGKAACTILRSRKYMQFSSLRYCIVLVLSKLMFVICIVWTNTGKRLISTVLVNPRLVSHF